MQTEETLAIHHEELIEASNAGDSATLIQLSKIVSDEELHVEELFEELEVVQSELDAINEAYAKKIEIHSC